MAVDSRARRPLIAGNWKMNLDHLQAIAVVQKLAWTLKDKNFQPTGVDIAVIPPFTDLRSVQTLIAADNLDFQLGAQDLSAHDSGAHTGDISGAFLRALACDYVLVGHSERRADHGETSAMVAAKAVQAIAHDLAPMICVGESLDDRQSGRAGDVVEHQLRDSLTGVEPGACFAIAYEPIWAIGTGKTAGSDDIAQMHGHIRSVLTSINADHASVPILYGGSVKPGNAGDIFDQQHVDGALVGGASLDADQFLSIIRSARSRA